MIVIHAGLKKCGSASIQYFLSENCDQLRQISLEYPTIGRRNEEGGLYRGHHNFAHEIQRSKKFAEGKGTLAECSHFWSRSDCRVMMFSSELFEDTEIHEALVMREMLLRARSTEEFCIYFVIRDLVDLVPSSYSQKIKYGLQSYDFDTFFTARMKERRVNFFDTVQRWAEAFGWENIEARVLDSGNLLNGDLTDDFLAICGITNESDKHALVRTGVQNRAPGWRVLEATRALCMAGDGSLPRHPLRRKLKARLGDREFGMALGRCAEAAGTICGWNSDRGCYLTRGQAQHCNKKFSDAVLRLNEKLLRPLPLPTGLDERGFCEREFLPDATHIAEDEVWELLRGQM